uniref:Uncharacterized protein n=1 Tax=Lepeophtheirus salmonis TaxID=72036 RepID=A0A0K2TCU9_LEPSM
MYSVNHGPSTRIKSIFSMPLFIIIIYCHIWLNLGFYETFVFAETCIFI